jgi:uroporphyrinogen decarboxylase
LASPLLESCCPDWRSFVDCIARRRVPGRVHYFELFLDPEVEVEICRRFDLLQHVDPEDPFFANRRHIAVQRFLGYDYVRCGLDGFRLSIRQTAIEDTADIRRESGRLYMEEHEGPIRDIEDFERFPWPDPGTIPSSNLEWYERNLPDDMCIVSPTGQFAEYLTWLMGYERFCYALYDDPELVRKISTKLVEMYRTVLGRILQFDRVKVIIGSDDMGYKTGTLAEPGVLRAHVFPGHRLLARMAHDKGRLYVLHSCGNLRAIMEDLIADVGIDGKHSFEDGIETVVEAKASYGSRIAILGGIDVDFLCRSDERAVRDRVRQTLQLCMPGGGYCLGTGNSVANYIPLENYLAMLDEGRKFVG